MQQKQHITERADSVPMATMRPLGQQANPARGLSRLFLRTTPNGTRVWVQRIEFSRREREIVLGAFPELSLAEARQVAARNRQIIDMGGDPVATRRSAQVMLLREELDRLSNRVGRDTGRPRPQVETFGSDAEAPPVEDSPSGAESVPADEAGHALQPALFGIRSKVQKIIHLALRSEKEPARLLAETEVPESPQQTPRAAPPRAARAAKRPRQEVQAREEQAPVVCHVDVMAGLRLKAGGIGPNVAALVRTMLLNAADQDQGIAECSELLTLETHADAARLDAACAHALKLNTCSLSAVMSFLNETQETPPADNAPDSQTIAHGNIRGADYFH